MSERHTTEHVDEAELRELVRHTLSADRVLAIDDHLAECEACRTRAAAIGGVSSALLEATDDLRGFGPEALEEQPQPASTVYRYLSLAAAIILLALAPFAIARWWPGAPEPASSSIAGLDQLSVDQRARVESALTAGVVDLPPVLVDLIKQPEVLMGQSPSPAFQLTAPLMTVTLSDRPVFRWQPMPGADDYTVAVFDADLKPVAGPATVTDTTWTPPQALTRERDYLWQVTARRGATAVTVPAPPEPFARFRIMDAAAAADLERLTRATPQSHVVLGIMLTQAGARQDALEQLRQVASTDPYAQVAERTTERLAAVSRPR